MSTTIQTPAEETKMTKFAAIDNKGREIGIYDSRDAAAGACQDAAREADSDGEGYTVEERAALFAAIGTDGLREVVWGVGDTAEAAEADALEQAAESDCDPALVRTVAITPEQAARIDAGTVAATDLGL